MTQNILFRGKRMDNGEWITGDLSHAVDSDCIFPPRKSVIGNYEHCKVDPETIGQYTGLHDKNGTPIFTGDIIGLITADGEEITITCEFGTVRRQIYENEVEITGFYFVRSNDGRKTFPIVRNYLNKHDTELWEIVGNIYDNGKGGRAE